MFQLRKVKALNLAIQFFLANFEYFPVVTFTEDNRFYAKLLSDKVT